jgi:Fuc2NAc and GlcNAc transferase
MGFFLLIAAGLLILSYIMTFIIMRLALKHSLLDIPNERSSHEIPTPRGGGVAIVISWFIGITSFWYFEFLNDNLYFALLSGIILAVVSLLDDIFSLPPFIRLLAQFLSSLLALFFIHDISPVSLFGLKIEAQYILFPVAVFGLVWFINLYNFLDGIDGYASLEAIAVSAAIILFTRDPLGLIIIFSVAGFLIWNWPKAKIFMGDIGSTQLGFILAVLGIYYHNTYQLSIFQWLMLTSLFWFDATLTIFRRWRNNEKLSVAHRKHVYQRAVAFGLSHAQITLFAFGLNVIIFSLTWLSVRNETLLLPASIIIFLILVSVVRIIDKRVPFI